METAYWKPVVEIFIFLNICGSAMLSVYSAPHTEFFQRPEVACWQLPGPRNRSPLLAQVVLKW